MTANDLVADGMRRIAIKFFARLSPAGGGERPIGPDVGRMRHIAKELARHRGKPVGAIDLQFEQHPFIVAVDNREQGSPASGRSTDHRLAIRSLKTARNGE